MSILEQAHAYLELAKDLVGDAHREKRRALHEALPQAVREEAYRIQKAAYFAPENARLDERKEELSPSGKYKLAVTPFSTRPGAWCYSQGLVYRTSDGCLIAEVQRNYHAMPFAWIEGHTNGHDYLVI